MRVLVGLVLLIVILVVGSLVAGYVLSNQVLEPDFDVTYDLDIKDVQPGRIVLAKDERSDKPGTYGLDVPDGHAVVGRIISRDGDSVTRTLRNVRGKVTKDEKGRVSEYTVFLGQMVYFDLNGDGVLDAKYDRKANQPMIFINGGYVPVEDNVDGFRSRAKWGVGRKTRYVFEGDAWKVQ